MWREKVERRHRRCVRRAPALLGQVTTCAAPGGTATAASDNTRRRGPPQGCESTRLAFDCLQRVHGGARAKDACEVLNGTSERAFVDYESRRSGNVCFLRWIGRIWLVASVLQSLARSSDSLGVCATRGTNSISDSLLGIEAADVALLVVRVLAAAIPSEDYWRFSDVSRGVRAAPRRAPTSEGLRQGPQPHTSKCVRPRTAVRGRDPAIRLPALRGVCGRPGGPRELRRASCPRD